MKQKLLFFFSFFLMTVFLYGQETITIRTTSSAADWQLGRVTNTSGALLDWEAVGTFGTITVTGNNNPIFNFSGNVTNAPIDITITSSDNFNFLTELDLSQFNQNDVNTLISDINVENAENLITLVPKNSSLLSLDVSQNIALQRLFIIGNNRQLNNQALNTTTNTQLREIRIDGSGINSVDFTTNTLLTNVRISNARLTSAVLDQVLIDLDSHGLSNGILRVENQIGSQTITSAAFSAYNSLIAKGWFIDVPEPAAPSGPDINLVSNSNSIPGNGTNIPSPSNNTNFGSVVTGGTITKTFTIENLGDLDLDLTGTPAVQISGANAADFSVTATPITPVGVAASTTFDVTFTAGTLGVRNAVVSIASNDIDEPNYTFNIEAQATATALPEINVTLDGNSIVSNNTPSLADGTDFGQVPIGSVEVKTITIQNIGDAPLTINFFFNSTSGGFSFNPPGGGGIVLGSGASTTIDVTFNPPVIGAQTGILTINNSDSDEGLFVINLAAEGVAFSGGEIEVQGNGITILENDSTPDLADGTDFGQVVLNNTETKTYTIVNNGQNSLTITNIELVDLSGRFEVVPLIFDLVIPPGLSADFEIEFTPTNLGNVVDRVDISHTGTNENDPFRFRIAGEGVDAPDIQEIMFSQYYGGFNINDKWIEITNISQSTIPANTYYLALYDNSQAVTGTIETATPIALEAIPELDPGEVILYRNPNADTNINFAGTPVSSPVGVHDPNDLLILTTSSTGGYPERVDVLGFVDNSADWGSDKVLIKGACSSESAHRTFSLDNWQEILIVDVDVADANLNIELGTQRIGSTEFDGVNWSNGVADQSREVIVTGNFTGAPQTITTCNLIVNSGVDLNFDSNGATSNSIIVEGNITVNGTFTIGDTESLITDEGTIFTGIMKKIERSAPLTNIHDITYWATPVIDATIGGTFPNVDPNRIFRYNQSNDVTGDPNGPDYYDVWEIPSLGTVMINGRGYISEGPSTISYPGGIHQIEFNGRPNNGLISRQVQFNADANFDNDFNLVGNPYPSAISMTTFFDQNALVRDIMLWTHQTVISGPGGNTGEFTNADYIIVNRSGIITQNPLVQDPDPVIGSSQGFMTRVTSNGNIVFNNTMRIPDANYQFYKTEIQKKSSIADKAKEDKLWLDLSGSEGDFSQILIAFLEMATDDFDDQYDSPVSHFFNKRTLLYTHFNDYKLQINGNSIFNDERTFDLGFETDTKQEFAIKLSRVEGVFDDKDIYLVDHLLNKTHNLKEGDYKFNQTEVGDFPNRFTLQFSKNALSVEDIIKDSEFVVSNVGEGFQVRAGNLIKEVNVYDMLGRRVMNQRPNLQSFYLDAGSIKQGAVLIFEVKLENGNVLNKKAIKL